MQWRFKITSTNNNVQISELGALPIIVPYASSNAGLIASDISFLVTRVSDNIEKRNESLSRKEIDELNLDIEICQNQIDSLVLRIYGLAD